MNLCRRALNSLTNTGRKPQRKRIRSNLLKFSTIGTFTGATVFACTTISSPNTVHSQQFPLVDGGIRFFRSMKIGIQISLDYTFSTIGLKESAPDYGEKMSHIHQRSAERILAGCLANGGTYIKLGQGLVSMNHILPKEYTETLKELQDKCLHRESKEVHQLFMEDFGKEPEEIYKSFDHTPIAAASLAQVYKATTTDGKDVAVKVQYIDLQNRFKSDMATIEFLMSIIAAVHRDFDFAWILAKLKNSLKQELDFLHEGKNAEQCASDLKHLNFVYVPKIYWDYCSRRVLVTEFIDGYKINEAKQLTKDGFSLADIDTKLFRAFGEQIFQTGFVHADPHPGNVLVRRHDGQAQIVLLDHGLYEQLREDHRVALSEMWKALVMNDHEKMKKYSNDLGVKDHIMFAEILTQTPLQRKKFNLGAPITDEDIAYMMKFARERFDSVMAVLRTMPSTLLLVLRNLNTIRAIVHDHGDPIDRFRVLTRCATKTAFKHSRKDSASLITYLPMRFYFELRLLLNILAMWFQKTFLKLLRVTGRLSADDADFLLGQLG